MGLILDVLFFDGYEAGMLVFTVSPYFMLGGVVITIEAQIGGQCYLFP